MTPTQFSTMLKQFEVDTDTVMPPVDYVRRPRMSRLHADLKNRRLLACDFPILYHYVNAKHGR